MKTQILITILLTLFVRLLNAQTDTTFNYIDKKFHKCLSDTSGVMGQSFCLGNTATDWENELTKYDKLIQNKLTGQLKQDYISSQNKWTIYRDSEVALAEQLETKYYADNPEMLLYTQIATERELNIIKTRTVELLNYYELISNSQLDSATIIIKNVSKYKFTKYLVAIKGQTIGGLNLKSGQSRQFKIAVTDSKLYRFTVYLDKNYQDKFDIPPMDYFSQVSETEIKKGTYTYLIDIDKKDAALIIKLVKTE